MSGDTKFGDVTELTLAGVPVELQASGRAAIEISRTLGGLLPAARGVAAQNADAIAAVLAAALDLPKHERESLPHNVYESGITKCAAAAMRFLGCLMNAGKALPDGEIPLTAEDVD